MPPLGTISSQQTPPQWRPAGHAGLPQTAVLPWFGNQPTDAGNPPPTDVQDIFYRSGFKQPVHLAAGATTPTQPHKIELLSPETPLPERMRLATNEKNPLRQGLWRYWGYINEMAEALAPQIKRVLGPLRGAWLVNPASYRVVDVYAVLDGVQTARRTHTMAEGQPGGLRARLAAREGLDALLFQQLASVYLPATVVSGVRKGVEAGLDRLHNAQAVVSEAMAPTGWLNKALGAIETPVRQATQQGTQWLGQQFPKLRPMLTSAAGRFWLPTAAGLATIPLVLKPIDRLSQLLLNVTYRPLARWLVQPHRPTGNTGGNKPHALP